MVSKKTVLAPFAIVLAGGLLGAYLVMSRPQARPSPVEEKVLPVRVVNARIENVRPDLFVYGEIISGREAEIRSMVSGRIVELDPEFRSGAYVVTGQRFARIDPFDYDIAVRERQANLDEARAALGEYNAELETERKLIALLDEQLKLRETDRDRAENLVKKRQTSEKALDDAQLAVNAARQVRLQTEQAISVLLAKIDQQHAAIARAEAQLELANRDLADTVISAPFAGYLQGVDVATGKRLAAGESLGRLIDAAGLEARFELPNTDYARLIGSGDSGAPAGVHPLAGTEVRVKWRVGESAYTYRGHIERVEAEIDSTSGGVGLYARIDEGPLGILRPGAFVEVTLPDVPYDDVIMLPETAVSGERTIYVIEDSRLVAHTVDVIRRFDDKVLVRGEVESEAPVVAEQFPEIAPGLRVRSM